MGICGLKKWALMLTFWVALQSKWLRATDLSGDNLTLTGTADIQGNTISLGTGSGSNPGWQGTYTDGTTAYVDFMGTRDANIWRWWQKAAGTAQLQLTLDNNNTVTLYDQSATPVAKIILNPLGASSIANSLTISGSLTVNGTDNQMPNQTLTGSNSVLTVGLGDGRYISTGAGSLALGMGSTATGTGAFAAGINNTASGQGAITLGGSNTASGSYSFASGQGSTASGAYSVAMQGGTVTEGTYGDFAFGFGTTASGYYSATALGNGTTASGNSSFAEGLNTVASGRASVAMGNDSHAGGDASIAMGRDSRASGSASTAMGYSTTASGRYAVALGVSNTASGNYATALGAGTMASDSYSTALGVDTTASGYVATAMGNSTTASGGYATASGFCTTAQSFNSFTMGVLNVGGGSTDTWVATDPLFEIGNGGGPGTGFYSAYWCGNPTINGHADAFVVYKNGNATLQGTFTVSGSTSLTGTVTAPAYMTTSASGDIPMFGH